MEKIKTLINKKILIAAGVSLLLACILEMVIFQFSAIKNGYLKEEMVGSVAEDPTLIWNLEQSYVDRVTIVSSCLVDTTYVASIYLDGAVDALVSIETINQYSGIDVLEINAMVDKIVIFFPDTSQLQDENVVMKANTSFYFNWVRFVFFLILFWILLFFIMGKNWFANKPENVFVVISLAMGLLLICSIGTNQISFDEQIHAATAYNISFGGSVLDTDASLRLKTLTIPRFQNIWEREAVEHYLDRANDFSKASIGNQSRFLTYDKRSYLPISMLFAIGRLLGLPFAWVIALGKLGNLLVYTFISYLAIKWAKQGNALVAVIALIPNSIFTASAISYDGVVTCFLLLASVLVMNEFMEPYKRLEWKKAILILGSFIIGCTAKQIYILIALSMLFFSYKKFPSKINTYIFKVLLVALTGVMLYHILFPEVPEGSMGQMIETLSNVGDSRVSETSVLGQIQYILSNPLGYMGLLLKSMFLRVIQWFTGKDQFLTYGYLGNSGAIATSILFLVLFTTALVAPKNEKRKSMGVLYRILNLMIALGMSAVVWTSLYLSFNAVGNTEILGVQNRYFIPVFFLVFSCLLNKKFIFKWKSEYYYKIIFGVLATIHLFGIYLLIMKPYYL